MPPLEKHLTTELSLRGPDVRPAVLWMSHPQGEDCECVTLRACIPSLREEL